VLPPGGRNPNNGGSFPNVKAGYEMKTIFWPPFDLASEQYLHIGNKNNCVSFSLHSSRDKVINLIRYTFV